MSKGNKIHCVRLEPVVMMEMNECIRQRNLRTKNAEWTTTGFIVSAIIEKLKHMQRSRKTKLRNTKEPLQHAIPQGGVIQPDPREADFWGDIQERLEEAEREAIDGAD